MKHLHPLFLPTCCGSLGAAIVVVIITLFS
jgi:hypothetical protein